MSRLEVVFARFIDDPDEAVAACPSVGDLPIGFSELKRGTIAPVAHTEHVGRPRLAQHGLSTCRRSRGRCGFPSQGL